MKATHEQTRTHNSRLILRFVYQSGPISRAEIARRSGLTRTSVSTLTDELIAAGWVVESGLGPSIGGKPPTLLSFNPSAASLLALDLSEEPFRGAVFDLRGQLLSHASAPAGDPRDAVRRVLNLARRLHEAAPRPVLGLGVGSQGVIDVQRGVVLQANRLGWVDLPLRDRLEAQLGLPVHVLNDSHAAAFGVYAFADPPLNSLVVIQVGEGISAGILLNGQLFHGDGWGAGEISHNRAVPGGEPCHCGHTGCLQTVASSTALLDAARAVYRDQPASALRALVADPARLELHHIAAALQQRDPHILAAVETVGGHLGRAAAGIIGLLNVRHVYFTGPLLALGESLLQPLRRAVNDSCLASLAQQTTVATAPLHPHLTLSGAAAYVLRHKLGVI